MLKSNSTRRSGHQRKDAVNPVQSAFPFTNIGRIDDDVLVVPLNQVISGQVTLQKLDDQCGVVKEAEVQESGEMPSTPLPSDSASV